MSERDEFEWLLSEIDPDGDGCFECGEPITHIQVVNNDETGGGCDEHVPNALGQTVMVTPTRRDHGA